MASGSYIAAQHDEGVHFFGGRRKRPFIFLLSYLDMEGCFGHDPG